MLQAVTFSYSLMNSKGILNMQISYKILCVKGNSRFSWSIKCKIMTEKGELCWEEFHGCQEEEKGKSAKSCTWGGRSPVTRTYWGLISWKVVFQRMTRGSSVDSKQTMGQKCNLISKAANSSMDWTRQSACQQVQAGRRFFHSYSSESTSEVLYLLLGSLVQENTVVPLRP